MDEKTIEAIDFYPRSPRGERQSARTLFCSATRFLSTLPARGATKRVSTETVKAEFLSTLPARGATGAIINLFQDVRNFYPRSPRGERRVSPALYPVFSTDFYPRSPRGERLSGLWL